MVFKDITNEKQSLYHLGTNEQCVFFMLNRSGDITFELAGTGAKAHIFSFFIGRNTDKAMLNLIQNHLAEGTTSHALIKSVLFNEAQCTYTGLIHIDKKALESDASQESRAILLSPDAKVTMKPTLEILADAVHCHHAATASPLSKESLFFTRSRGLSEKQSEDLLIHGFFNEALERMEKLGVETTTISKEILLKLNVI